MPPSQSDISEAKESEDQSQVISCPSCKGKIALAMTARRKAETVVVYELTLEPGHMVTAQVLGQSIASFDKLMKIMSKDLGGLCLTMVKDMWIRDGKIHFDFLIVTDESTLLKKHKADKKNSTPKGESL